MPKKIKKIGAWWLRLPCPSRSSDDPNSLLSIIGRPSVDRAWTLLARKYELPVLKTASVIKAVGGAGGQGAIGIGQSISLRAWDFSRSAAARRDSVRSAELAHEPHPMVFPRP